MKSKFLLDAMLPITDEERKSGLFVPHNRYSYQGKPDYLLLEKAITDNLVIITKDVKFVMYAIIRGVNIIYQNKFDERFYIYGSQTKFLGHMKNIENYV